MAITTDELLLRVRVMGATLARDQLREVAVATEQTGKAAVTSGAEAKAGIGGITTGFKGLAAAVGVTGLAFGLKDLISNGVRLQEQQTQLRAAMRDVGITGEAAYKKLDEATVRSTEHGGFSRDQEINSVANFIRVTKNSNDAIKANQAAVELSRGAHLNYASVQRYIQQALVGNVKRLQQYTGILIPTKTHVFQLEQAHKELILQLQQEYAHTGAAGAVQLKQAEIMNAIKPSQMAYAERLDRISTSQVVLNAVHARFPNALRAYNNSTAGQLNNLKNTFEVTIGNIGEIVMPAVRLVVKGLTWLVDEMNKHKIAVLAFTTAITVLASLAFAKMLVGGIKSSIMWLLRSSGVTKAWSLVVKLASGAMGKFGGTTEETLDPMKQFLDSIATMQGEFDTIRVSIDQTTGNIVGMTGAMTDATGVAQELAFSMGELATASEAAAGGGMIAGFDAGFTPAFPGANVARGPTGFIPLMNQTQTGLRNLSSESELAGTQLKGVAMESEIVAGEQGLGGVAASARGTMGSLGGLARQAGIAAGVLALIKVTKDWNKTNQKQTDTAKHVGPVSGFTASHGPSAWPGGLPHPSTPGSSQSFFQNLFGGHIGAAAGDINAPFTGIESFVGGLFSAGGGRVPKSKHLAQGGPFGTDTVSAWLTPGEDVINAAMAEQIGAPALGQLNAGNLPGFAETLARQTGVQPTENITVVPGRVVVQIGARAIAEAVVQYTLQRAARGPSSLIGGSLVTGMSGPATTA